MTPLSAAQARLWLLQRVNPDSATYNESGVWHFGAELDPDAMREALAGVAQRQTMLRTRFPVVQGNAVQLIESVAAIDLEFVDLGARATDAELDAIVRERATLPFDLAARPALRSV